MMPAILRIRELGQLGRAQLAVRGSVWVAVEYGGSQVFRLASTLVLARYLLGPEAFGFVALVNVFLAGLEMLSDFGVGPNVVQHQRGHEEAFLNTAFMVQAARALVLWALATALAYPFALFYQQPKLFPLALAAAAGIAVRGFASPAVWALNRQVRRGGLTALTITAETVGFTVAMVWALAAPTAAALVAGALSNATTYTLGSYLLPGHRVSRKWDRSAAHAILRFGAWISVASGTYFLSGQAERLVLGKFITPQELGCFSVAVMLATGPSRGLEQLVVQVLFPLIARSAREEPHRTARYYTKARLFFLGISLVMVVGFVGLSRPLVALLLPSQYVMTGWMLQLLGVRAAFDVFGAPASALLLAGGLSIYSAAGNVTRLLFIAGGLYVAFSWFGLREAVWVLAMSPVAIYFPAMVVGIAKHFKGLIKIELAAFLSFILAAGLMGLAWWMTHGGG
jgi:O-antigen/teichoic acid export membrane protein